MLRCAAAVLVLIIASAPSLADGKFFAPEEGIAPDLPYQRALLVHEQGIETLVIQSRYEFSGARTLEKFGWVVPVPAVPELASLPADAGERLFDGLWWETDPEVVYVSGTVLPVLLLTTALAIFLTILSVALRLPGLDGHRRLLGRTSLGLALLTVVVGFTSVSMLGADSSPGVEILSEQEVGVYDVTVVRADDGGDLVGWLRTNGFGFGEADRSVIDDHVRLGWCFVAARLAPERAEGEETMESGGLVAPLILRFPTEKPIYPLKLTGAAGADTEVVLYVLARSRLTCGDRLETTFAARSSLGGRLHRVENEVEPRSFPWPVSKSGRWLHRFAGRLTAEAMEQDLVLQVDEDAGEVRPVVYRW